MSDDEAAGGTGGQQRGADEAGPSGGSEGRGDPGGHRSREVSDEQLAGARAQADASKADEAVRGRTGAAPRDMTAATGRAGGPASWRRAVQGARTALHRPDWADGRWSYLFGDRTPGYADAEPSGTVVEDAARRFRGGEEVPVQVQGPMMKAPVWTWEVPLYFWFGGMAAGSSFVALACDVAGDERSAQVARRVAVAALLPSPPLLIMDLGRPERFYNMLRIFKPRSPMSMGAWCLSVFGGLATAAVGADLLGRRREAKLLGGANAVVGGYLGSYTGVLLASTAVPVWARSRLFLGPIFVTTATLTGASTVRLVLAATGLEEDHPTLRALGRVESGAMATELVLSQVNEVRLGRLATVLEEGEGGRFFLAAKALARAGLAARVLGTRTGRRALLHVSSGLYLGASVCFRYAWVRSGPASARDDEAVARTARGQATRDEPDLPLEVVHHQ